MLANHPSRKGIDTPHEIRNWRDTAPGHRGRLRGRARATRPAASKPPARLAAAASTTSRRAPTPSPAIPLESYRTWGGFDFMTSTVGGLWDSLLAEGKPWWITANSDSHKVYADWAKNSGRQQRRRPLGQRWRHVQQLRPLRRPGVRRRDPDRELRLLAGLLQPYPRRCHGLRLPGRHGRHAGRSGLGRPRRPGLRARHARRECRAPRVPASPSAAGCRSRDGNTVELTVNIELATGPNFAQFTPKLNRVDLIAGDVLGPATDRDTFTTPSTKVVKSWDTSASPPARSP